MINGGAQMLMGSFDSGSTAAMVPVAQQRHIPFLVDIAAADPITANVAKSVKEGQQKVQYVYRNFPTGSSFGRKAVQYFTRSSRRPTSRPKRVVAHVLQRPLRAEPGAGLPGGARGRQAVVGHRRGRSRGRSRRRTSPPRSRARRPRSRTSSRPSRGPPARRSCCPSSASSGVDILGVVGPGSPGLYEAGQLAALKEDLEHVMDARAVAELQEPADAARWPTTTRSARAARRSTRTPATPTTACSSSPTSSSARSRPTRTRSWMR